MSEPRHRPLLSVHLATLALQFDPSPGVDWSDWLRVLLPAAIAVLLLAKLVARSRTRPQQPVEPFLLKFPDERAALRPVSPPLVVAPATHPAAPPPPAVRARPAPARPAPENAPTVRIDLTAGRPLEFLPGRLEIVNGLAADQEFRFPKPPGAGPVEITLGREAGSSLHHLQISAPTVSRLHARLRFENAGWMIENLSDVNPLCLNGVPLPGPHPLSDGDKIQVGEVVLRYRQGTS